MLFKVIFAFAAHRHGTEKLQYYHKNFAYLCSIKSKIYTQKSVQNRQPKKINFNSHMPHKRHPCIPHERHPRMLHERHPRIPHERHPCMPHERHSRMPHKRHSCMPHERHPRMPHKLISAHSAAGNTPTRTAAVQSICREYSALLHKKHNFYIQKETLSNLFYPTVSLLKGELTY